jgi:1,4-dihydroxy-2-naphthoate octaprenyltransferase
MTVMAHLPMIRRTEKLRVLRELLNERKIVFLSAFFYSGKTVLLDQLCESWSGETLRYRSAVDDWADFRSGVDNEQAFAVPNLVFGHFQPAEYLRMSIVLFVVGCVFGAGAVLLSTPAVLWIGAAGVLLTILYSFLKYHALGDMDIFLIFGVLTVLGSSAAATGNIVWDALVLSVPLGIITVSVLHANNTVDIETDKAAGIKTFAMLIGAKASALLYQIYMVLPFACVLAAVFAGLLHPLSLLCLAAVIPAWKNLVQAGRYGEKGLEAMKGLDQGSAKLQLVFSGLLSLGLCIAGLL